MDAGYTRDVPHYLLPPNKLPVFGTLLELLKNDRRSILIKPIEFNGKIKSISLGSNFAQLSPGAIFRQNGQ